MSFKTATAERQLLDRLVPYMAVVPPFDYSASGRCLEKGLLPSLLLDSLRVLQFLSVTVLSAQKAQRSYGVRASVLLSMALLESSFDAHDLLENGPLSDNNAGTISPQIDAWFMAKAKSLATSEQFKGAVAVNCDVKAYIRKLGELGFCEGLEAADLCATVDRYDLDACDLAGMLPVGVYHTLEFDKGLGLKESPLAEVMRSMPEDEGK